MASRVAFIKNSFYEKINFLDIRKEKSPNITLAKNCATTFGKCNIST
jgi:hypothetical protein